MITGSPPFRSGGKGTKQLSAVLTNSQNRIKKIEDDKKKFAFVSDGSQANLQCSYFGIIMAENGKEGRFIQPLRLSLSDSRFFVPWEGHLWLAPISNIYEVHVSASICHRNTLILISYRFPRWV
jgi:hypothetical protein